MTSWFGESSLSSTDSHSLPSSLWPEVATAARKPPLSTLLERFLRAGKFMGFLALFRPNLPLDSLGWAATARDFGVGALGLSTSTPSARFLTGV